VSAVPLRKPDVLADLLRELLAVNREALDVLRAMRAEQRKRSPVAVPALIAALEERYGPASFTVRMVLDVVDEEPHGALAEAVAQVLDMNASARSRAVTLGALLTRLREIEIVAEQRGASLYKLRREYVAL
jgi:hypothetical protein